MIKGGAIVHPMVGRLMLKPEEDEMMKHIKIAPRYLMILDLTVVLISASMSFFVRFGYFLTMRFYIYPLVTIVILALIVKPIVFTAIGFYRPYWGYVTWREIRLLVLASTVGTLAVIAAYLLVSHLPFMSIHSVPRSMFAIDWLMTLLGVGSIRWIAHSVLRQKERKISGQHKT